MPSPGPNGSSSTSRVGVAKTVLAAPARYLRAAASASRGPNPTGTSIARTEASDSSSKLVLIGCSRWSATNLPPLSTMATQPPFVPSMHATVILPPRGGRFSEPLSRLDLAAHPLAFQGRTSSVPSTHGFGLALASAAAGPSSHAPDSCDRAQVRLDIVGLRKRRPLALNLKRHSHDGGSSHRPPFRSGSAAAACTDESFADARESRLLRRRL